MRKQIANLVSNILNPFLVSLVIILLLSFESTRNPLDALRWSAILVAVSLVPVYSVMVYFSRNDRLGSHFIDVRKQRTKVYLLAGICALVGCIILVYLEAPLILLATFVAGLSATVIFMGINLGWKISLHAAFIAASITLLVILYGSMGTVTVMLLPLVAWARLELGHHSLAQVTIGALLAALIVIAVFYLFGLV
jgi:membrane-associated phospholipid phosphatase